MSNIFIGEFMNQIICMFAPIFIALGIFNHYCGKNFTVRNLLITYFTFFSIINLLIYVVTIFLFGNGGVYFSDIFAIKYLSLSIMLSIFISFIGSVIYRRVDIKIIEKK